MGIYTDLFATFCKIGSFTLGGGYAMVPVMEREIVEKKQWLTHEEFMDILVVAQSTPGIFAVDMASHIGYSKKGIAGGIVGALGVAVPSIAIILLIALLFNTFKDNIYVEKIFMGVRPCVVALILAPCFKMAKSIKINIYNCWVPLVCAALIAGFGVNPIWCIIVAGTTGFLVGHFGKKQPTTEQ